MNFPSQNPPGVVPPACQAAREELLASLDRSRIVQQLPPSFHCDACRLWFERARGHARALGSLLPRVLAVAVEPSLAPLDGRVVAELNAGRRQERAAAALVSLKRLEVPASLEAVVAAELDGDAGHTRKQAPGELDLRVALELSGSATARIARQLGALDRYAPPAELEGRVRRVLSMGPRSDSLPIRRWIAVAATLLAVFGVASMLQHPGQEPASHYDFRIVHVDSTASLDPFTKGLMSASFGSVLDVPAQSGGSRAEEQRR